MKNLFKRNTVGQAVFELNKLGMKDEWSIFFDYLYKLRLIYDVDFFTITNEGTLLNTVLKNCLKMIMLKML